MYGALADKDENKLTGLTKYYKKLYNIIAIVIFILGVALIPFLQYIVKLDTPIPNLELYYFIFLLEVITSYLFVYKTSIVIADQKEYKLKFITMFFAIARILFQIMILLFTKNYLLYILSKIIFLFFENFIKSYFATKWYPYINEKHEISKNEKKEIWGNIKSLFYYKFGAVILSNIDNILISVIVNTATVGLYSNYNMVISQISSFTSLMFTTIHSSIGNLNAVADEKTKYFIFKVLDFMAFWIFSFCSICFIVLFNDFILLMFGTEFVLSVSVVVASVLNYYLQGLLHPVWCFRYTTDMFKYVKYTMIYASIINIVLSIILGKYWGLFGIILATIFSRLFSSAWYEPYILFKKLFQKSSKSYFCGKLKGFILFIITLILTIILAGQTVKTLRISNLMWGFIVKMGVCLIIPNLVFLILLRKKEEFVYLRDKAKEIFLKNK